MTIKGPFLYTIGNSDDMFLDNLSLEEFKRSLKIPVFVYARDGRFPEILRKVNNHRQNPKQEI